MNKKNIFIISESILIFILLLLNLNFVVGYGLYFIFGGLSKFLENPISGVFFIMAIVALIKGLIELLKKIKKKEFFTVYILAGVIFILVIITLINFSINQPELNTDSDEVIYDNFQKYSDEYISLQYPSYLTSKGSTENSYLMLTRDEISTPPPEAVMIKFYETESLDDSTYDLLLGLKSNMVEQKIITHENSTLGDYDAIKVVYEYNQEIEGINYEAKAMRVTSILPDIIIQIIFISDPTEYDTYIGDIEKLIDSIKLK